MGQMENKYPCSRFKPKNVGHDSKYKWSKHCKNRPPVKRLLEEIF